MKSKIRKLCGVNDQDDTPIRLLKQKILKNLDRQLPESDFVKTYQILDPETRSSVAPGEVVEMCTSAFLKLKSAGFVTDLSLSASQSRTAYIEQNIAAEHA